MRKEKRTAKQCHLIENYSPAAFVEGRECFPSALTRREMEMMNSANLPMSPSTGQIEKRTLFRGRVECEKWHKQASISGVELS